MLDLYNRTSDQSAYRVLYPNQKYFILALIAAVTVSAIISSTTTFMVLLAAISLSYFIVNPLKSTYHFGVSKVVEHQPKSPKAKYS